MNDGLKGYSQPWDEGKAWWQRVLLVATTVLSTLGGVHRAERRSRVKL